MIRVASAIFFFSILGAQAQVPRVGVPQVSADPAWRTNLSGLLSQPSARAGVHDVERMQQYLYAAAPYCTSLTTQDYETNRALARSMAAYLGAIGTRSIDDQTRGAVLRMNRALAYFPCAFQGAQLPDDPSPVAAARPDPPPFAMLAPRIGDVPAADRDKAKELTNRYEIDATNAASVWKNAETMRLSLAQNGMTLNSLTATALSRFQLFFGLAAGDLTDHHWDDALADLQGAEAETKAAARTVGR